MRLCAFGILALVASCAAPPRPPLDTVCLRILYLGIDGRIRMYDEVVSRCEQRVTDAARQDDPICAVRYSYTVHLTAEGKYFVSL